MIPDTAVWLANLRPAHFQPQSRAPSLNSKACSIGSSMPNFFRYSFLPRNCLTAV